MPFQVSPGVNVTEIDLTTIVPAVSTTEGALAGVFRWGPIDQRVLVDSETILIDRFARPTNLNPETWFTAASFLSYGNRLYVSRAANTTGVSPQVDVVIKGNTSYADATVYLASGNTENLQSNLYVIFSNTGVVTNGANDFITTTSAHGFTNNDIIKYVVSAGNTALTGLTNNEHYFVVSANSTAFKVASTLGGAAIDVTASSTVESGHTFFRQSVKSTLQLLSNTAFSAVVNTATVANLAGQIVKNEDHFTTKSFDDEDVKFVARFPGEIGNSLKISVCANSTGYSETVNLASNNATLTVNTNSNTGAIVFNTVGNISYSNSTFNASSGVNGTTEFITTSAAHSFANGDVVKYIVAAGNTVVSGLANGTTYYVVGANSTALQLAATSGGSALNITAGSSETGHTLSKVTVTTSATANATTKANLVGNAMNVTDKLEVGNTLIGVQYIKITNVSSVSTNNVVNLTVSVNTSANDTTLVSLATGTTANLMVGDLVLSSSDSEVMNVAANAAITRIVNSTAFVVNTDITVANGSATLGVTQSFTGTATLTLNFEDQFKLSTDFSSNTSVSRYWEFFDLVDRSVGLSDYQIGFGNNAVNSDEMHVVVVDEGGKFTGVPGTILEVYREISRATDAKTVDGATNYWKNVINDQSQYVWAVNDISGATSNTAENLTSSTLDVVAYNFNLGRDGADEANIPLGRLTTAYDKFKSAEDIDISLILTGKSNNFQLGNYLIDNIAEIRKDCVVFISPQKGNVVSNIGNEVDSIISFRDNLRSTSYAVLDSGYKYMYDRYNDVYRWIPLNGDIAGLCVRTDSTNDPWWSPAGFNRGQIKNSIKLAFNPRKSERDSLYKAGVNPVVTFPGQGTVLFGDKTLLAKPSAFDRINVRRLFIVLEKAIATASKFTLFEFNDDFTRSQFKNLVVPYLRDVQGRRGITDFLVVCDGTNNTPEVIDRNEFIGDIYIKPARSINFIQLNFIAVRTGVAFSEVVGKF